ncbi:unnamed protein product, partial [Brenthis ino]
MLRYHTILQKVVNAFKNKKHERCNSTSTTYPHIFKDLPKIQCSRVSSGLTVATEERKCNNVCLGFYINAGSRHEDDILNGITYFFQHIAYKGTQKKSKTKLEDEMSNIGPKFKCFTTRDTTAFYVECHTEVSMRALDILYHCIFNNAYAEPEIEIQKDVVYQEMLEHDKCPSKVLHDYLHSSAFQGTPLGQPVMGLSRNLYNFKPATIRTYLSTLFVPKRIVMAAVGGVKHEVMVNLAEQYFRSNDGLKCIKSRPNRYTGSQIVYRDDSMKVAHVAIAVEGPSFCDEDKICMELASSVIGGWDKSQPGGTNHGMRVAYIASSGKFCESYKAFDFYYEDTGLWGVEFISPRNEVDDMVLTIQDEWMRLCYMMTDGELIRAKNEMKTKIIINNQSTVQACHDLGQNILRTGQHNNLLKRLQAIDKITSSELKNVCDKYIYDRCPVVVGIGATESLQSYPRIRSYMYWLRL